ncbi:DUF2806 domain-containing protein [Candidatus Peregrinibacteria bacterium]|nr:MAG: DUF2806 domain-containing protein [Candidatus Peregrinibacteria bacterium]
MADPTAALTAAIDNATKVANTPLFTTVIDRVTGFKISQWAAEGEVRKRLIHDEYEKAKENGIMGVQYIENLRHTTNLIDTAVKSAKYIEAGKENDIKMDNDFFWNTVEHSKHVSNEEVQDLIAKIIASEYNKPDSYAMSTLHSIKMLGKGELELFENISALLINGDSTPKVLFSLPENAKEFLGELGIDFGSLQILQNLGLFLPNDMTRSLENPSKQKFALKYFDKEILFEPTHESNFVVKLPGFYALSITGKQIIQHLKPKFNEKYCAWLKENYKIPNYKIIEEPTK